MRHRMTDVLVLLIAVTLLAASFGFAVWQN